MNFIAACSQVVPAPLAQALDVFIVRLVLLLVHFQRRSQDFDVMLFLRHALSVFKLAYNRRYRAIFKGLQVFIFCVWLNAVLRVGKSCLAFRDFFVIDNSLPATYHMRLRYAGIARVKQQI